MRLELLETMRQWRATVKYHDDDGQRTVCLMDSGLMDRRHYWFIADYQGELPWDAISHCDPCATARLVEAGQLELIKGQWPEIVAVILARFQLPGRRPGLSAH